ncbi:hypothetical protein [Nocardia sp. NPDC056100]
MTMSTSSSATVLAAWYHDNGLDSDDAYAALAAEDAAAFAEIDADAAR